MKPIRAAIVAVVLVCSPLVAAHAQAPAGSIRHVAVRRFALIVKGDGSVIGFGQDGSGMAARPRTGGAVTAPEVIGLPGKARQAAVGDESAYALLEDGTVVAWGANDEGQLGNGAMGASGQLGIYPKPSVAPVKVTGLADIVQIEAGAKFALALRKDGAVFAWGTRDDGAIGDGQPAGLRPLKAIGPVKVPGLEGITQIAAGRTHALALRRDGRVMSWGSNRNGELGVGTRDASSTPAEVSGLDRVVAIDAGDSAGHGSSGAVRDDGTVWMWGSNASAMLGDSERPLSPDDPGGRLLQPVQVKGVTGAKGISIGSGTVAALLADGTLRMWGHDGFGQMGVGIGGSDHKKPAKVATLTGVASVYLGGFHSIAVRTDGTLWVWGFSFSGEGVLGKHLRVPTRLDLP